MKIAELLGLDLVSPILIIEDRIDFASRLASILRRQGFTVDAYLGIIALEPTTFRCEFAESITPDSPQLQSLSHYRWCFLDHYFLSPTGRWTGTSLLPVLKSAGVQIVGMSSSESANQRMLKLGAAQAMRKDRLDDLIKLTTF